MWCLFLDLCLVPLEFLVNQGLLLLLVVMNLIHLGQVNQLLILEVHLALVLVLLQSPLMHLVFFS